MKKILVMLLLLCVVYSMANIESANAARKSKKAAGGITAEELTTMGTDIDKLTSKIYAHSLFSPEENAKIIEIKMKLDSQMLVAPDPSFAPMYYKLGKLFLARNYKPEAIECFQTILENFADTALAPKAVTELKALGVEIKDPSAGGEEDSADSGSGDENM